MRNRLSKMLVMLFVSVAVASPLPAAEPVKPGKVITNSIGMKLALIPAGEFTMGSPDDEPGPGAQYNHRDDESPRHKVRISEPFYLGIYEVTQAEFTRVMETNRSAVSSTGGLKDKVEGIDTSQFPADNVNWDDATEFCRRLSALDKRSYRLPTEAEWEYSCRAGTESAFSCGATCDDHDANCMRKLERSTKVGSYAPNAFGLYDMHGNVQEWCADWYDQDYYAKSPKDDPVGPALGTKRVLRGGAWTTDAEFLRSAIRQSDNPRMVFFMRGFRVALPTPARFDVTPKKPVAAKPAAAPIETPAGKPGEVITNSIGMKLVFIPAGKFLMGSPETEFDSDGKHSDNESPQHRVRITKPFYLGVYEVTQDEYKQVIGFNPSEFSLTGDEKFRVKSGDIDTARYPVEAVSADDAKEFCKQLSLVDGRKYRLPTEAEWEYACRAETTTAFSFGPKCNGKQANCVGQVPFGTSKEGPTLGHPTTVGSYAANAFGLYDMHGNASEWCADCYDANYYAQSPRVDPTGPPEDGSAQVVRGGAWGDAPASARSAHREVHGPKFRNKYIGLRVLVPVSDQSDKPAADSAKPSAVGPPASKPRGKPSSKPK